MCVSQSIQYVTAKLHKAIYHSPRVNWNDVSRKPSNLIQRYCSIRKYLQKVPNIVLAKVDMRIHCLFTLNHETLKRLNYRWSLAAIRRHEKRITFLIILLDTVSQPLFPDADTWIYSHAATQYHAQGVTKPGFYCAKCGYIYVSEESNRKWRTYSMLKHLN